MVRNVRILLTGFCAPGFTSIVYALRKSKRFEFYIYSTDWKSHLAAHFADKSDVIGDNLVPEWPSRIIAAAEREKAEVLIPIRTDDLAPLARNIKRLRELGIEPTLPSEDANLIETLYNKVELYTAVERLNLETPNHYVVTNIDELEKACERLGYPDVPICIKPAVADGSRGFRILDETKDREKMFFSEKPDSTYSDLETIKETLGESFRKMLIMEFLPGREYTIDILCQKGNVYAVLPRLRSVMTGGITTGAILAKDDHFDFIRQFSEKIVNGFNLSYNIGIQLREDREGNLKLLEMNPRLQGTTIISVEGGVNIPEIMVDMALGTFNSDFEPKIKWGLKLQRVWREVLEYEGKQWTS
ncbi:MAG: ATP-grasp domain-containing protein [Candidatus Thorarchaeota archaeon]|nr:ATP-grasp domain-containing protein [Candidatus Thorarchaeota archaeon]